MRERKRERERERGGGGVGGVGGYFKICSYLHNIYIYVHTRSHK